MTERPAGTTRQGRYDGSFKLAWLRPGEFVRSSGSRIVGGCEIATEAGAVLCQLVPGDVLMRTPDGRPFAVKEADRGN